VRQLLSTVYISYGRYYSWFQHLHGQQELASFY